MKTIILLTLSLLGILTMSSSEVFSQKIKLNTPEYRNFFGISWRGTAHQSLVYAKQMGYEYVFYMKGMEKDPLSDGLYFYIETPEYFTYPRYVELTKSFTPAQIDYYNKNVALSSMSKPFPQNLATGWFTNETRVTANLDFQQQRVITHTIDSILGFAASIENANPKFRFGGFAWDEPDPSGDFWNGVLTDGANKGNGKKVTMAYWNGGDHAPSDSKIKYDYTTYTEGHMAFYKQLFAKTRAKYPGMKTIMEPYRVYDMWVSLVEKRPDVKELSPDILSQEQTGTDYITDKRIYASGLIQRENMFCTTPAENSEVGNRVSAASAAVNGSWFSWYGRLGGSKDMPNYQSIAEVPARIKLISVLSGWENLNKTPLNERKWDGETYQSPTAFASPEVIYLNKPNTFKLFFVLLTANGKIKLPKGKKVATIFKTDGLFVETQSALADFNISDTAVSAKNNSVTEQCYIVHLK